MEEKHFWEFPFPFGMQRLNLCFYTPLPTPYRPRQLKIWVFGIWPFEKSWFWLWWGYSGIGGLFIFETWNIQGSSCGRLVLGYICLILLFLWIIHPFSRIPQNKINPAVFYKYLFLLCIHLTVAGIFNFAHLQRPYRGRWLMKAATQSQFRRDSRGRCCWNSGYMHYPEGPTVTDLECVNVGPMFADPDCFRKKLKMWIFTWKLFIVKCSLWIGFYELNLCGPNKPHLLPQARNKLGLSFVISLI